jgi:hypothetical protein
MADIYSLNRAFWDFAFENTGKIKPNHIAVYQFSIEHCNRLGWKKQFGFPTSMVLDATGIKSYSVYKSTFDDLVNYGFFKVIEYSKNQYSSNIIALVENYKANSKANGNFHFKNRVEPITDAAHKAIRMLHVLKALLKYHEHTAFIIENPTSALFSNPFFKEIFFDIEHCFIRTNQKQFGHHVVKMTDLCTNMNGLFLSNPVHRVNGRYSRIKMDNLTLKKRQSYPPAFVEAILDFSEKNFLNLLRE